MKQPMIIFSVMLAAISLGIYAWHMSAWKNSYHVHLEAARQLQQMTYNRDRGHAFTEDEGKEAARGATDDGVGSWRIWLAVGGGLCAGFCFTLGLSMQSITRDTKPQATRRGPAGGDRRTRNRSRRRGDDPERQSDEKICPHCAEIIKRRSKVCRFCGHHITKTPRSCTAAR